MWGYNYFSMPHIKKTLTIFLISALLGGWAWYLNSNGTIGGVSSSVLATASTFSCTEDALRQQVSTYRKIALRHKKALVIKKSLEAEILALKTSDPENQLQKKEEMLKLLVGQINTYFRFIRKYDTCKKEIKLNPTVSSGIMSGEAQVIVSSREYQALAAFKIQSPTGLNTYINALQFKIDIRPEAGVVVDQWFLLHEGANPIICQSDTGSTDVSCELSGDMPVDIMSGTSRNYAIGAHITSVTWSGTVDIQISKIQFNTSRTYTDTRISPVPLGFGPVVVPVQEPAPLVVPVIVATPAETLPENTATTPESSSLSDWTSTVVAGTIPTPASSETTSEWEDDTETLPWSADQEVDTSSVNIPTT